MEQAHRRLIFKLSMIQLCNKTKTYQLAIAFISFAVIIISALGVAWNTGVQISASYVPNIDSAMEIRLELSAAHLWLEEVIAGNPSESIDSVYNHIDKADWYTKVLLDGGENEQGRFYPPADQTLRGQIELLRNQIGVFRVASVQRWENNLTAAVGSNADQQYDALFIALMSMAKNVESAVKGNIQHNARVFQATIAFLGAIALLAVLLIAITFRRYRQQGKQAVDAIAKTNEKLQQQNEEREDLIYAISHDLKSPTVTIVGFLKYIKQDLKGFDNESTHDAIERIEKAALRMRASIDDLLELSRIGRVDVNVENVDTKVMIESVAKDLASELNDANVKLDISGQFPVVQADAERLRDVFDNLLSNAIKYGCPHPDNTIAITGEQNNGDVIYRIADQGPGIAPEFHEKVFGLFNRLDSDKKGTGVGLAVVKRIIEVHGGKIDLQSTEGKGATFSFSIPVKSHLPLKKDTDRQMIQQAFKLN